VEGDQVSKYLSNIGRKDGKARAKKLSAIRRKEITPRRQAADAAEPGGAGDGEHSPWVSRLLKELEHEVIVAQGRARYM
jgi:hypothetical protein